MNQSTVLVNCTISQNMYALCGTSVLNVQNIYYLDLYYINHTAPGPPKDLTLVNRTCHSITFQWSPPDDTGRLDVTGYDILHNGTPVATITGTVYTLEGLTPDTVHTISARTRNAIGASVLEGTLTAATGGRGIRTCTCICIVALIHCRSTIQYMHTSITQ